MTPQARMNLAFALAATAACTGAQARSTPCAIGDTSWHRSEWRASSFSMSRQSQATLAIDAAGRTVVAWSSRRQQGGRYGVYLQAFDADGVAVGGETVVNLWRESHQRAPAIAAGDGGVWVAWQSYLQDGDGSAVVARRFDVSGATPVGGDEILVNLGKAGDQTDPVVAADDDGRAVVAWTSSAPGAASEVVLRWMPDGGEVALETPAGHAGRTPALAFGRDGALVAAWGVAGPDGGVRVQAFGCDREPIDAPVAVTARSGGGAPIEPVVAATSEGFVAAWLEHGADGDDFGVVAQRLDGLGRPVGEPFLVNEITAGPQVAPAVAVADDGRIAVAWNDSGDVRARLLDADATPIGNGFRLNLHADGTQALRAAVGTSRIAFGPAGSLAAAWSGDGGFGDATSVNVTMLSPRPVALAGRTQGVTGDHASPIETDVVEARPHVPPTFDPKRVQKEGERQIAVAGGDLGFTGVFDTGWTPPDPHMAVGPDHIVVMTNGNISFFTKDGLITFTDQIEDAGGFWGSEGATDFVFDPEVLYDPHSERFFAMAAEGNAEPLDESYVLVAVSDDSDPNGTWFKYRFNTTALSGDVFDSPNIAVDEDVVYITGDRGGSGSVYPVYTMDKASLLVGDPPAVFRQSQLTTTTESAGIPAVSSGAPALYMVEHREGNDQTAVRLIALREPLGLLPVYNDFTVPVATYSQPESPPQEGTSLRPITFDARFWSVAYRNGSLWATHHVNSSRVRARWYEFATNGWPESGEDPELVQWGEIDLGSPIRTFFSAITVDDTGNAAITYARSSPSEFISMATSYRFASDPPGTFGPSETWASATGPYNENRWGDYAAIRVDPVDGKTIWAHHEYAVGNSWRTWVQRFEPFFPVGDYNCDGAVNIADLIIVITNWGPCPDPPAACPGDGNGNGEVEVLDLAAVITNWG